MPDYERYIKEALELLKQLVEARSSGAWPQWAVSLFSVTFGAAFGFIIGYGKYRLKERRDNELLREALYQEIANNYEAILYWTSPDRCDFDWLKINIHQEITFFAYEAAGRSSTASPNMDGSLRSIGNSENSVPGARKRITRNWSRCWEKRLPPLKREMSVYRRQRIPFGASFNQNIGKRSNNTVSQGCGYPLSLSLMQGIVTSRSPGAVKGARFVRGGANP